MEYTDYYELRAPRYCPCASKNLRSMRMCRPPYLQIASELYLSPSRVHASVKGAKLAHLLHGTELGEKPNYVALEEFLIHGVQIRLPRRTGRVESRCANWLCRTSLERKHRANR